MKKITFYLLRLKSINKKKSKSQKTNWEAKNYLTEIY